MAAGGDVMFDTIHRLFKPPPAKEITTKFTEEQVLLIANRADIAPPYKEYLDLASVEVKNGRVRWTVTAPAKSRREIVFIDDASGEIVKIKHVGMR